MEEEKSSVFRKESLQRIQSPEQLTDYLKVTSPGTWMVLIAVIVLLIGILAWGTVGKLDTVADGKAVVMNGTALIYLTDNGKGEPAEGMTVRFDDSEYKISSIQFDDYGRRIAVADVSIPDGKYDIQVVTESVSPISFLLK